MNLNHRLTGIEKLALFLFTDSDKMAAQTMIDCGYSLPEIAGWARANPRDIAAI
ncbi:MAG TPA: hypothetical protein VMY43_03330 [Methanothrix sp.]|jgi:hypothetical protein|nr:hypothetical protein [Methanothrix sp.]